MPTLADTRPTYVSTKDTAKHMRKALRAAFPGVKFSVRSNVYSGGSSIDVSWEDGPAEEAVRKITDAYAGGRFDGMIDLAYHANHWLMPDGSIVLARTYGHGMGMDGDDTPEAPEGAQLVSWGSDYVFTRRDVSEQTVDALFSEAERQVAMFVDNDTWPASREAWTEYGRTWANNMRDVARFLGHHLNADGEPISERAREVAALNAARSAA